MMVHTDKKHFRCCSCPAQFKGRENLRKHVSKFHRELLKNVSGGGAATSDRKDDKIEPSSTLKEAELVLKGNSS